MKEKTIHANVILEDKSRELDKEFSESSHLPEAQKFNTGWKKNPELADLKSELNMARNFHDSNMSRIEEWRKELKAAPIEIDKNSKSTRSTIQPKVIRKMAEWRYASLSEPFLSNDELFAVSPRTWEDRDKANINSILLNYQFKTHLNLVNFIGEYIRTIVNDGIAVIRPFWVTKYETQDVEVHTYGVRETNEEKFMAAFEAALDYYDTSPSQYLTEVPDTLKKSVEEFVTTGSLFEFFIEETEFVQSEVLVENHPSAEVFPIDNVYFDPSAGSDYKNSKFVVFRYESDIASLQKEGIYQNLDSINVDSSSWTTSDVYEPGGDFQFGDRARKRIEVMEYWGYYDVEGNDTLTPIVVTWVGDTIIRMEESPFSDKQLPLIVATYMPQPRSVYGEPDAELLHDNQRIVGAVTRGVVDILARNANGQQGIAKGMMDPVNRLRFQRGQDYEYNPNHNPEVSIINHKFAEIPNSAFQMLNLINAESESLTGVKAFNEGLTQNSLGKVATSVRGVLDAASKRESDILRRAAEGIEELGRRFLAMNGDFLEDNEIIRITNDRFVTIFRKEIAGKFDLKLSITTAEESAARAQELAFMVQTIAPGLDPQVVKILLAEYARLSKLPDVAQAIRSYEPQPDPMAQQMQMLQLQEQMLKVEQAKMNLDSTAVENALNQAKIMVEQAKAAQLQSLADKQSLDFVEQESGVKQARDVERIQAQAMGNIALEERKMQLQQAAGRRNALEDYIQSTRYSN